MAGRPLEREDLELELLLTAVNRQFGYDFRAYGAVALRQRVRRAMGEEGVESLSGLQERLLHDRSAIHRFIAALSRRRIRLFDPPPFFHALRAQVVPWLRTHPKVCVWVAGCATGEDVYALAILLREERLWERCRIYATDLSENLLARAREGRFPAGEVSASDASYRQAGGSDELAAYIQVAGEGTAFVPSLRERMVFASHNLATDASFNEFQLIVCRGLIRRFAPPVQERAVQTLHDSLSRSGVLGLGPGDDAPVLASDGYRALDDGLRLYRRTR
jgi:chemotaxis protein methyltransferase CheR